MGFGRRKKDYNRNNHYKKKMNFKTKIRIVGVIVMALAFVVAYVDDNTKRDLATHQKYFAIMIIMIIAGMAMILQRKLLIGLKNISKPNCQCCKCQNCGRNHNHWVHDDNDNRRLHY